jgi:magnesium chelatase subunit H
MQKHITAAEIKAARATPVRVVIVTMDTHVASATERARATLARDIPGLTLNVHAASEFSADPAALDRCRADIAQGDIIINTMLFLEDHFQPLLPALEARRDSCDAMVCCMSAAEVTKLTRMGSFDMAKPTSGPMALLKKLRGGKDKTKTAGAQQMRMLRRIPAILKYVPGTAQDMRAYFLTLQYWLSGSEANMNSMVRYLVDRYASGPRQGLRGTLKPLAPIEYPDTGVYHPALEGRVADTVDKLPVAMVETKGTVGLLLLRSYILADNSAHYDGVITALETRGLRVIPCFATGLDGREAIEKFFIENGRTTIDTMVSLTGFSLVGGPAYNDAKAAEDILAKLDVPYIAAHPAEFQTLEEWGASDRGLLPVESTIMVAIPELDGAIAPTVFGGRSNASGKACTGCYRGCIFTGSDQGRDMHPCGERAEMLSLRVEKLIALRRTEHASRKVAIVLFNFPPNAGNTGTAAYLSVFASLHRTMLAMKAQGYTIDVPETEDALREHIINGNREQLGSLANVHTTISADNHVRRERWLKDIEAQWGPAPGRQQTDGSSIQVLGERFGNVFVGVQPSFGYEGDPMRLLFEKGFAPTHAFSAFYRWVREDFGANAVLHFGTHGALEFMPGKQTGLSETSWPDRLIGDLPNVYLYASNNPSEGAIAKRRAAATLVSYLTPPVSSAGLYRGLVDLKASLDRWRQLAPDTGSERTELAELIKIQAEAVDLPVKADQISDANGFEAAVVTLTNAVLELEYTLIPHGLHVVGAPKTDDERCDALMSMADAGHGKRPTRTSVMALLAGDSSKHALAASGLEVDATNIAMFDEMAKAGRALAEDHEIPGILKALEGRYLRPAPGGDLLRTPAVLPTGRNLHGFDPFRIPSVFAVREGAKQAAQLLVRHMADGNDLPETVALVLWGTDNLKTEGAPIGQALALMGAKPRFDSYGRLAGAELIALSELGRPRIDVCISLSGIFRDLLPLQIKLMADACFMAASADEPVDMNYVRKHALAYQAANNCDMETASLRVFGNAEGAYGSNVNNLVESSRWDDEDELAETYTRRKGFAYGRGGRPVQQPELLKSVLKGVDLAYQNLDSVELGVTTVDNYFDTLGGISRAVRRAKGGKSAPVYIGDQTKGEGTFRTLGEQVALETRTRMLNPKWYEGMLKSGYEGVRQIETHLTNTMGWSATTGEVEPWVYQRITQTFMLDPEMRERLAKLNPTASAKISTRLLEAHERNYWQPDEATLAALRQAGEELEDRLEGIAA